MERPCPSFIVLNPRNQPSHRAKVDSFDIRTQACSAHIFEGCNRQMAAGRLLNRTQRHCFRSMVERRVVFTGVRVQPNWLAFKKSIAD